MRPRTTSCLPPLHSPPHPSSTYCNEICHQNTAGGVVMPSRHFECHMQPSSLQGSATVCYDINGVFEVRRQLLLAEELGIAEMRTEHPHDVLIRTVVL